MAAAGAHPRRCYPGAIKPLERPLLAQPDRASGFEPEGWGFESLGAGQEHFTDVRNPLGLSHMRTVRLRSNLAVDLGRVSAHLAVGEIDAEFRTASH